MKFKLSTKLYDLMIKEVENVSDMISAIEKTDDYVFFDIKDISELHFCISDEIIYRGMDNQDTVNELGIELYHLYDELLYQEHYPIVEQS